MTIKNVLFATDVPFWQKSTGAEERIFALHRFLNRSGFNCAVFYLGDISDSERADILEFRIEIFENTSERPPDRLANRIRWYADATLNQARNWLSRGGAPSADPDLPPSLKLSDFAWPWATRRFCEVVEVFRPDCIIFEYIKMSYLMAGLPDEQRRRIKCLVDTHDVLHKRAEQFFAHGFPHWLEIDRAEESRVLNEFDAVLAIQEQEAETFRNMTGNSVPVLIVGHAVKRTPTTDAADAMTPPTRPSKLTVGYIGSKNFSNWQAIREFLITAWPAVLMRNEQTCDLVIAGAICDWFETDDLGQIQLKQPAATELNDRGLDDAGIRESGEASGTTTQTAIRNVRLLGRVDRLEDFYDEIDVVINPVQFGTGLKIKNAESLRFGKLLITTLNGFNGMPEATRLACMVVESVNEMGLAINSVCNDLSKIRPMQTLALELAQTEFSETQAYSELKQYLLAD